MKAARFSKVVEKCGRPSVHLTWVAPQRDRSLMSALKESRIMTVHHVARGGQKDFGTVGLLKAEPGAQLLIFPKSLRRFSETRIVGINYDLLAEPESSHAAAGEPKPDLPHPRRKTPKLAPAHSTASPRISAPPKLELVPEPSPRKEIVAPPPVLTWSEALGEVEKARHDLKRRPDSAAARLGTLAERIGQRLRPR
ncbi:MAG: hypothetical protein JWM32_2778 [Verrucomicrobia bacterium]|nr:hypothetical protein [Verrucomicrobiota bacterium]